jgi:hypothetical protein
MSGLETATQPGVYWAVAFVVAVLVAVIAWLAVRLVRERRTARFEYKRLARELGTLQVRLGSQQHELERMQVESTDRAR